MAIIAIIIYFIHCILYIVLYRVYHLQLYVSAGAKDHARPFNYYIPVVLYTICMYMYMYNI